MPEITEAQATGLCGGLLVASEPKCPLRISLAAFGMRPCAT